MTFTRTRRLLTLLSCLATAAAGVLLVVDACRESRTELEALKEQLRTEVRLLAEHTELAVYTADLLLQQMADDAERVGLQALMQEGAHWESMRRSLAYAPQFAALSVVDADGRLRYSTDSHPGAGVRDAPVNVSDRGYFQAHRNGELRHVGQPLVGRLSGRDLMPVSRRLETAGGEFAGMIGVLLDLDHFWAFYESLSRGANRRMGVYSRDGTVVSMYPAAVTTEQDNALEGASDLADRKAHTFVGPSPVDGKRMVISYRFLESYPLAVSTAHDHRAFAADLYPIWLQNGAVFLLVAVGVAFGNLVVRRSIKRAEEARAREDCLARERRRSDRLAKAITARLPNGRVAVVDDERRYVFVDGQAFGGHQRLAPDRVLGKRVEEVHNREAASRLLPLVDDAFAGHESETEIESIGRTYKVVAVPLEDDPAGIDRVMLLTQDITDLKTAQRELEARNRTLRDISLTDGLLDIANRRAFDHEICREWRRAQRRGRSLALLMVDVDYFKPYNDTYGHTAGDDCLRRVAAALEDAVVRSDDMVARYGGEEIAVLLPDTELTGALQVAERIHRCLAEEAIPFPDSPGRRAITVSIGAAACAPPAQSSAETLVTAADRALYQAKKAGRNRTACGVPEAF